MRTTPGQSALTRTPKCTASSRSPRDRLATAAFVAPYGPAIGVAMNAAIEAVLTMCPKPCRDHSRVAGRDTVHDAEQVDLDRRAPVVERERARLAADGDARVVEQVVEPAVAFVDIGHRPLDRARIAHVERECLAAPGRQPRRMLARRLFVTVGEHDRRAPRETSSCDSAAPMPEPAPVTRATRAVEGAKVRRAASWHVGPLCRRAPACGA